MGLFATDEGWGAACGRCPVALTCHTGWLRDIVLCPKCGIFQVRTIREKTQVDEHTGEEVITGVRVVLRVECPARQVSEDQYIDWCQEADECRHRPHRCEYCTQYLPEEPCMHCGNSAATEDATITERVSSARILIPDKGPPQKQYVNNTGGAIPVALCDQCYLKEVDDV